MKKKMFESSVPWQLGIVLPLIQVNMDELSKIKFTLSSDHSSPSLDYPPTKAKPISPVTKEGKTTKIKRKK